MQKEVIKRLTAYQLHGHFSPSEVLSKLPSLVATVLYPKGTFTLYFMTGQEYHYPYCLLSPYRELPDSYSRLYFAHCRKEQTKDKSKVRSCCFLLADHGAAAKVAYAHYKSNRNVFDEWVFSCQGCAAQFFAPTI